jgi:hypothetical protein
MADNDNIEELDSWAEMEKVLAVVRAGAIDAGAYLVVLRKLREATRVVYAEGFCDGINRADS